MYEEVSYVRLVGSKAPLNSLSLVTHSYTVKRSEIGDFGGSSLEHLRRWPGRPVAWASLWECRAAQSRQARAKAAQGASWGTAKEDTLAVLSSASETTCAST